MGSSSRILTITLNVNDQKSPLTMSRLSNQIKIKTQYIVSIKSTSNG